MESEVNGLLALALGLVGNYLGLFLHELGHFVAALAVGWRPLVFRLGSGPRVTAARCGDLHIQLGVWPLNGLVAAVSESASWFRLKWFVFAIAGPTVTAGVIWILWWVLNSSPWFPTLPPAIRFAAPLILFLQCALFLGTVWPRTITLDGKEMPNDAKQAWMSMRMRADRVPQEFFNHQAARARIYMERGEDYRAMEVLTKGAEIATVRSFELRILWIHFLLTLGRKDEADSAMSALPDEAASFSLSRSQVLDGLACLPLFYGHSDQIQKAMAYIDEAIKEDSTVITLKGTKGSLLVEADRCEEGLSLLQEVMSHTESKNDIAICSYYMALAHRGLGNWQQAREILERATREHPNCVAKARVTRLFWSEPL